LQEKMAQLDLQGLRVQLALPELQVQQDQQVQLVLPVLLEQPDLQVLQDKMQRCTRLNQISAQSLVMLVRVIKI
jgi:hypothetical protein